MFVYINLQDCIINTGYSVDTMIMYIPFFLYFNSFYTQKDKYTFIMLSHHYAIIHLFHLVYFLITNK